MMQKQKLGYIVLIGFQKSKRSICEKMKNLIPKPLITKEKKVKNTS